MKDFYKFKKYLSKNEDLKKRVYDSKSLDEAISLAKENGFNISKDDILGDKQLGEDILESISGGSKSVKYQQANVSGTVIGNNSHIENYAKIEQ